MSFLATAKPSLIFGYAVFPRYIACFWSFDRSNSKINRSALSIHVTGSEFRTAVYQPIEKKQVFIAGLQPDHVYSLAVHIVTINPLGFKGLHEESLVSFVEATPKSPISE